MSCLLTGSFSVSLSVRLLSVRLVTGTEALLTSDLVSRGSQLANLKISAAKFKNTGLRKKLTTLALYINEGHYWSLYGTV